MSEHQSALWEPWHREVAPSNDGSLIITGREGARLKKRWKNWKRWSDEWESETGRAGHSFLVLSGALVS